LILLDQAQIPFTGTKLFLIKLRPYLSIKLTSKSLPSSSIPIIPVQSHPSQSLPYKKKKKLVGFSKKNTKSPNIPIPSSSNSIYLIRPSPNSLYWYQAASHKTKALRRPILALNSCPSLYFSYSISSLSIPALSSHPSLSPISSSSIPIIPQLNIVDNKLVLTQTGSKQVPILVPNPHLRSAKKEIET
ncbi:2084_t:CDS:2, partial [Gigaspora margarita]